jgi:hypothetical protein
VPLGALVATPERVGPARGWGRVVAATLATMPVEVLATIAAAKACSQEAAMSWTVARAAA